MFRWLNWKYNRDYLLDPKYYIIILLLAGPLLLIFGGVDLINQNRGTSKCTAVTYGVVVSAEKGKGTLLRDMYSITVEPVDPSIFNGSKTITGDTDQTFEKGKYVEINYDPSDSSSFNIEHSTPAERGTALLFSGGTLTLIGLIVLGFYKVYRKRYAT